MAHDPSFASEPSAAAPYDPVAWEHRVAQARTRRLQTLAARPAQPPPAAMAAPPPDRHRLDARRGRALLSRPGLWAMFLAGLGAGLLLAALPTPQPPISSQPPAEAAVSGATAAPAPPPSVARPAPGRAAGLTPPAFLARAPLPAPAELAPGVPAGTRLVVHAPRGLSAGTLESVLEGIADAGVEISAARRTEATVDASNLRFFHAPDRARAEAVAARAPGPRMTVRDFTHLSPRPEPGTLELWLAGSGGATSGFRPAAGTPAGVDPDRLRALVQAARDGGG